MTKVTMEQIQELFRQIGVGRISKEDLQRLLDIPCHVSDPMTAKVHIDAVRTVALESPLASMGQWQPDKDGNIAVAFRVAVLPRRKKGYTEAAVREVLASQGLRLPNVDEFIVCVNGERARWLIREVATCEDGSCISSHETEHSVRYLAIEGPYVTASRCVGGVYPCPAP